MEKCKIYNQSIPQSITLIPLSPNKRRERKENTVKRRKKAVGGIKLEFSS